MVLDVGGCAACCIYCSPRPPARSTTPTPTRPASTPTPTRPTPAPSRVTLALSLAFRLTVAFARAAADGDARARVGASAVAAAPCGRVPTKPPSRSGRPPAGTSFASRGRRLAAGCWSSSNARRTTRGSMRCPSGRPGRRRRVGRPPSSHRRPKTLAWAGSPRSPTRHCGRHPRAVSCSAWSRRGRASSSWSRRRARGCTSRTPTRAPTRGWMPTSSVRSIHRSRSKRRADGGASRTWTAPTCGRRLRRASPSLGELPKGYPIVVQGWVAGEEVVRDNPTWAMLGDSAYLYSSTLRPVALPAAATPTRGRRSIEQAAGST